ncbi:hypothetical protein PIB30_051469 [Stylosanthes scabra]|uniref:Uncharacterized protein n=1 Tax=Stylosanthes scabra TaxID=79078 RepID=A0ABU6VI26_9FABA|nr:hypothetical protein [Stylosanthes scabra]
MIDASSGEALMNKTPEEAWELIEIVADANQHFKTRATTNGVYEPNNSQKTQLDIAKFVPATPIIQMNACNCKKIILSHRLITFPTPHHCQRTTNSTALKGGKAINQTSGTPSTTTAEPKSTAIQLQPTIESTKSEIPATTSSSKPPVHPPSSSYDEALRAYLQESRELREAHKKPKPA